MKGEIDGYISRYGGENGPPPWQAFTIANDVREGNLHLGQKVFEGRFEVRPLSSHRRLAHTNGNTSLTSSIRLVLVLSQ